LTLNQSFPLHNIREHENARSDTNAVTAKDNLSLCYSAGGVICLCWFWTHRNMSLYVSILFFFNF